MEVYRISCQDCDVKGKMRSDESTARSIAKQHVIETGHPATVREVRTSTEVTVIED